MCVAFVPAADLKRKFSVLGHFYNVAVETGERFCCRSVMEIRRRANDSSSNRDHPDLPDAIVIMMNPGGSKPLDTAPIDVSSAHGPFVNRHLVPTAPDTTQYQVMRVMLHLGWAFARVLNLSDLREAKSSKFAKLCP